MDEWFDDFNDFEEFDPDDGSSGFYSDDGTKLNPELINKPGLCLLCKKDDDPGEYILCTLTRFDNNDENEFICYAFEARDGSSTPHAGEDK